MPISTPLWLMGQYTGEICPTMKISLGNSLSKRIIGIVIGARYKNSCRKLFNILKTLTLTTQYIFSITLILAKKKCLYEENSEVHNT